MSPYRQSRFAPTDRDWRASIEEQDRDLVPKPLRIKKKVSIRSAVPHTTSLQKDGSLSVRKHRRGNTTSSPSVIGNSTSEGIPGSQQAPLPKEPSSNLGRTTTPINPLEQRENEQTPRATQKPSRSVTVGPGIETSHLKPFPICQEPLILRDPKGIVHYKHRRAVSVQERGPTKTSEHRATNPGYLNATGHAVGPALLDVTNGLQRQPSASRRFFSRVLKGSKEKSKSTMSTTPLNSVDDLERLPLLPGTETVQPKVYGSVDASTARQRSSTASSGGTQTGLSQFSNLDAQLAVFPTPPSSALTSPNGAGSSNNPHGRQLSASRILPKVEAPIIMSAGLKVMPEIETIDNDGGQTIWVAVELSGDLKMTDHMGQGNMASYSLDVAVVIDNSIFTSTSALLASCEIVCKIASFLDETKDRMAVLCAYGDFTTPSRTQVVVPLRPVKLRKLKKVMDGVQSFNGEENKHEDVLRTAMKAAFDLLSEQSDMETLSEASAMGPVAHTFLITANADYLPSDSLENDTFPVHVIHPGVVPWSSKKTFVSHGWQLRSMYPPKLESIALSNEEGGLPANIRSLIQYARTGHRPGSLYDLVLDIKAARDCRIKGIMGSTKIASLKPGEVVYTFVKLKIKRFPSVLSALENFELRPNGTTSTAELIEQLDILLGERGTEILSVNVRYKHSLLPGNTKLSVKTKGVIHRERPVSTSDGDAPVPSARPASNRKMDVDKRLAFFIATHHPPHGALTTMRSLFGADGCLSACPAYVNLVTKELRHQARVLERLDLLNDDTVSRGSISDPACTGLAAGPLSDIRKRSSRTPSPSRCRPIIALKPDNTPILSPSKISPNKESPDKARQIWAQIRKSSRGDKIPVEELDLSDPVILEIQAQALKNQRSIGADTLRSLAKERRYSSGPVAPFL